MAQNQYIAFLLFFVALVDLPLGFLVAQRQPPHKRMVLMLAFVMSSLIIGGLGVAFWLKLIG